MSDTERDEGHGREANPSDEVSASVDVSEQLRVVRGNPTEDELAAVTAVLSALAEEVQATHRRTPEKRATAWAAVQRPLRRPIVPGVSRWRGFSG